MSRLAEKGKNAKWMPGASSTKYLFNYTSFWIHAYITHARGKYEHVLWGNMSMRN